LQRPGVRLATRVYGMSLISPRFRDLPDDGVAIAP